MDAAQVDAEGPMMMTAAKRWVRKLFPATAYAEIAKLYSHLAQRYPKITPLRSRRRWNQHQAQIYIWFEHAQKYLQVNRIDGVYAEFGHEVNTFRFALNTFGRYGMPNDYLSFLCV